MQLGAGTARHGPVEVAGAGFPLSGALQHRRWRGPVELKER